MRRKRYKPKDVFLFSIFNIHKKSGKFLDTIRAVRREFLKRGDTYERREGVAIGTLYTQRKRGKKRSIIKFGGGTFSGVIKVGDVFKFVEKQKSVILPITATARNIQIFKSFPQAIQYLHGSFSIKNIKKKFRLFPAKTYPRKIGKKTRMKKEKKFFDFYGVIEAVKSLFSKEKLTEEEKKTIRKHLEGVGKRREEIEKEIPLFNALVPPEEEKKMLETLGSEASPFLTLVNYANNLAEKHLGELEFDVSSYPIRIITHIQTIVLKISRTGIVDEPVIIPHNYSFEAECNESNLTPEKINTFIFREYNNNPEKFLQRGMIGVIAFSFEDAEVLKEEAIRIVEKFLTLYPSISSFYVEIHVIVDYTLTEELYTPKKERVKKEERGKQTTLVEKDEESEETEEVENRQEEEQEEQEERGGASDVPEEVRRIWEKWRKS